MSEAMRLKILNKLTSVIGEEEATKLMENIPPFDWHEIATKDDLAALKEWTEAKFDEQSAFMAAEFTKVAAEFTKVAAEFTAVRGEFAEQIGGLRGEIGEVHKEIGGLHKEIAGLHTAIAGQTRTMVLVFAGSALTVCTALAGGIWFA